MLYFLQKKTQVISPFLFKEKEEAIGRNAKVYLKIYIKKIVKH